MCKTSIYKLCPKCYNVSTIEQGNEVLPVIKRIYTDDFCLYAVVVGFFVFWEVYMLFSLGLIFLLGLLAAAMVDRIGLPRIIGMLFVGILTGPFVLGLLAPSVLGISSDLRQIALVVILVKAGLTLNAADLKKNGRAAVMMAFVPACAEIAGYIILAPLLFHFTISEAALMGAVLSAVSPAVVVPRMVAFIENKRGTEKGIPQMILAGASCDDVFVIVLFSAFLTMAQGGGFSAAGLLNIPLSAVTGVICGVLCGLLLHFIFEKRAAMNETVKVIVILGAAFILIGSETLLKPYFAFSGLLSVVAMACVIRLKADTAVSAALSGKYGKIWTAAELLLFVLVGAAVDITHAVEAGLPALIIIFGALIFRAAGVMLCLTGTKLTAKERLFCVIAYLPKATVQAAIGSVPLAAGLPCGNTVLSVAVLAILITAPIGAIGIDKTAPILLEDNSR